MVEYIIQHFKPMRILLIFFCFICFSLPKSFGELKLFEHMETFNVKSLCSQPQPYFHDLYKDCSINEFIELTESSYSFKSLSDIPNLAKFKFVFNSLWILIFEHKKVPTSNIGLFSLENIPAYILFQNYRIPL